MGGKEIVQSLFSLKRIQPALNLFLLGLMQLCVALRFFPLSETPPHPTHVSKKHLHSKETACFERILDSDT